MLALRDIMTREVVTVSPDLSIRDAMTLLTSRHISGAPVVASGRVLGVVSLTDLAEIACSIPGVPAERPQQTVLDDVDEPQEWVSDEEPPSAYFAQLWDDAGAEVTARLESTEGPEWNALEEHTVGEAMNRSVVSFPPGTPVEDAAHRMRQAGIHRVLVMEDGQLLGLVTSQDITGAVADQRLTKRIFVFDRRRET